MGTNAGCDRAPNEWGVLHWIAVQDDFGPGSTALAAGAISKEYGDRGGKVLT